MSFHLHPNFVHVSSEDSLADLRSLLLDNTISTISHLLAPFHFSKSIHIKRKQLKYHSSAVIRDNTSNSVNIYEEGFQFKAFCNDYSSVDNS